MIVIIVYYFGFSFFRKMICSYILSLVLLNIFCLGDQPNGKNKNLHFVREKYIRDTSIPIKVGK